MVNHGSHRHHGHVPLDEADWEALAAHTELEGELLLAFVTGSACWIAELRGPGGPPVQQVLDIGIGPGVGTCELARLFPEAHVVAVDSSPAMLTRAAERAAAHGLDRRVTTHLAALPDGLDGIDQADVIWASMSLHHMGDETSALGVLRHLLRPSGLLAIAEVAGPMRVLPDQLDLGRHGSTSASTGPSPSGSQQCEPTCRAASPQRISRPCSSRLDSKRSARVSQRCALTRRYRILRVRSLSAVFVVPDINLKNCSKPTT